MWQTPITNWASTDAADWRDYERWRQNIEHIAGKANAAITSMQTALQIGTASIIKDGEDPTAYTEVVIKFRGLQTEITYNAIESNLQVLAAAVGVTIPSRKTWVGNGTCPGYTDVNRWESACLLMYNRITMIEAIAKRLPVRLNGGRF